jgi:hypothetical protein
MVTCALRTQDKPIPNTTARQEPTMNPSVIVPVYSNAMRHLPMRLLVEPMEMDAALARLMPPAAAGAGATGAPLGQTSDAAWMWTESGAHAVEVTEHPLPDGIDFLEFHALLNAAH